MKQLLVIKTEKDVLEKQVNSYNNFKMKKFLLTLFFIISISPNLLQAQETTEFEKGKPYYIAKIDVTGKINYNPQTVITFTGLEKGQKIIVPGEEMSTAIKKLWKLGLFNDINFYVQKIEGDSLFLELNINELPKLSDVRFRGVKKRKN